jgi:L-amino acid N-acyltransferase YncA
VRRPYGLMPFVRIRRVTSDDAASVAQIYAPIVAATAISFEEHVPDAKDMQRRIAALAPNFPWLVAENDDAIEGYAYASPHRERAGYRWSVDVSIYIRERARGLGIGRKLYATLFAILARQRYYSAFAGVALPNAASLALHRSVGFTEVGTYRNVGFKNGAWHDVLWLARPLQPLESPPREPRPLDTLPAAEIAALLAAL